MPNLQLRRIRSSFQQHDYRARKEVRVSTNRSRGECLALEEIRLIIVNWQCSSFTKIIHRNGHRFVPGTSATRTNAATHVSAADNDVDSVSSQEFKLANDNRGIRNNYDRTWHLTTETIDVTNCTTRHGVTVQVDKVPINVLKNVQQFYICECCGKVYWDGSHMERALNGVLRDIIVWHWIWITRLCISAWN